MERLSGKSDEALVEQCRSGDREAFTELVRRHMNGVHWFVRRIVGTPDSEDITQEVFLRAYEALPRFRREGRFAAWLYRIARNLCLSELRKRGRCGETVPLEEEIAASPSTLSRDALTERIESRDLSRLVRAAMDKLPEKYRAVLTLFYLNEMRYEEIAAIMDIPIGTVKTHIHRGRLRLRNLLLEEKGLVGFFGSLPEGEE